MVRSSTNPWFLHYVSVSARSHVKAPSVRGCAPGLPFHLFDRSFCAHFYTVAMRLLFLAVPVCPTSFFSQISLIVLLFQPFEYHQHARLSWRRSRRDGVWNCVTCIGPCVENCSTGSFYSGTWHLCLSGPPIACLSKVLHFSSWKSSMFSVEGTFHSFPTIFSFFK